MSKIIKNYGEDLENYLLKVRIYENSKTEIKKNTNTYNYFAAMKLEKDKLALTFSDIETIDQKMKWFRDSIAELKKYQEMPRKFITTHYN